MNPLIAAGTLIIHVVFDAYIVILLLRLLLQKLRASWHNPISQFIIKLTEKPLKPLRKIAPGIAGFDTAIVFFALILQFIEIILLGLLQFSVMPNIVGVLVISFGYIISKLITIYTYAIIINALASWIPAMQHHPITDIIRLIVEPLLSRIRRVIPLIAGIDISPIPALLGLTFMSILIVAPMVELGTRLMIK